MQSNLNNKALFLFIVLLAVLNGILVMEHWQNSKPVGTAEQAKIMEDAFTSRSGAVPSNTENTASAPPTSTPSIPAPVAKFVPFTVQAPIGYWSEEPWADYAEEACVYMAYKWGTRSDMPAKYDVAENLKAIGQWEIDRFGDSALTDLPQTLQMLTEALGYARATLSTDISEVSIKAVLDGGAIVILPVNGQLLDNPYYGDPAPKHHMLVVYDYTEKGFFTNDPGTRRGEAFLYETEKMLESIQDLNGEKRMLVVTRTY